MVCAYGSEIINQKSEFYQINISFNSKISSAVNFT